METRKIIVKVKGYGQIKVEGGTPIKALRSVGLDPRAWTLTLAKETEHALHYTATPKDSEASCKDEAAPTEGPSGGLKLCPGCNGYYAADACPKCKAAEELPEPPKMRTVYGDIDQPPASSEASCKDVQVSGSEASCKDPKKAKNKDWKDVEVKVHRDLITQGIETALQVVSGKTVVQILSTVCLRSEPNKLTLQATDLDLAFQRVMPSKGGTVTRCVPTDLLLSEVKALPENVNDVVLTFKEDAVSVNGRADIITSYADQFPELNLPERLDNDQLAFIDGLVAALKQVLPAASTDQARYALSGVFLDFEGAKAVATDGFRLHVSDITPKGSGSDSAASWKEASRREASCKEPLGTDILLPPKAARILIKQGSNQHISISEDRKFASFPISGGVFRARLMEATFPDYKKVMPDPELTVSFSHKEFVGLVSGAKPLSDNNAVELSIGEQLVLKAANGLGFYEWHLPCDFKQRNGSTYGLCFNVKFLLDAMKSYPRETVTLRFPAAYGATIINDQAVLMPIRR